MRLMRCCEANNAPSNPSVSENSDVSLAIVCSRHASVSISIRTSFNFVSNHLVHDYVHYISSVPHITHAFGFGIYHHFYSLSTKH